MDNLFRSQFGKPSGLFGSVFMGPLLNLANMRVVNTTIEMLHPSPKDKVLDVGFGGGYSLISLARLVPRGEIVGVDYSTEMVARAATMIQQRGLGKRVQVECADVANLPFRDRIFDQAVSVNSIYYWPDPVAGLREIARVLKPEGRLAIGVRSPASLRLFTLTWQGFNLYERRELERMMGEAGLSVLPQRDWEWWRIPDLVVVVGERKTKEGDRTNDHQ